MEYPHHLLHDAPHLVTRSEACMDGSWKQFNCAGLGYGPCAAGATYGANCTKK